MAAQVDAGALLVRDGNRAFGFTADCGAGTATLDPGGEPHPLRLLRWREKCALARFAAAGADFVDAQFLAISGDRRPIDPHRRDAVRALAFWLHGAAPLPLDPGLLGAVTLDLCGALAIPPAALDALSAPEVEMLWRAHAETRDAEAMAVGDIRATPVPNGVTRILVEPDPSGGAAQRGARIASEDGLGVTSLGKPSIAPAAIYPGAEPGSTVRGVRSDRDAESAPDGQGADPDYLAASTRAAEADGQNVPASRPGGTPPPTAGEAATALPRRRERVAPRFRLRTAPDPAAPQARDPLRAFWPAGSAPIASAGAEIEPSRQRGAMPGTEPLALAGTDGPAHATGIEPQPARWPDPAGPGQGGGGADAARVARRNRLDTASRLLPDTPPGDDRGMPGRGALMPPAFAWERAAGPLSEPMPSAAMPAVATRAGGVAAVPVRAVPGDAPAIDARLGALIDIVARCGGIRGPEIEPDAAIDPFGDRLAEAVTELGLAEIE